MGGVRWSTKLGAEPGKNALLWGGSMYASDGAVLRRACCPGGGVERNRMNVWHVLHVPLRGPAVQLHALQAGNEHGGSA